MPFSAVWRSRHLPVVYDNVKDKSVRNMVKIGDTVRYLNSVGGGRVTRIEGQMAYVDEDGFETPVLVKEVVVVMPAGHEASSKGNASSPRLMFDQKAFDAGKKDRSETQAPALSPAAKVAPAPSLPVEETAHGDRLNVALAFEPSDVKNLSAARFTAVLVNDSNYFLSFTLLGRGEGSRGWNMIYQGEVAPNELIDLATYTHDTLGEIERVALQAVAFKRGKEFEMKAPISVSRRLDLTKFHKLHCFRPGMYFETPVLEYPVIKDDVAVRPTEVDAATIAQAMGARQKGDPDAVAELSKKYRVDSGRSKRQAPDPAANPNKLLPTIEVDLHIDALTDSTAGMDNTAMLNMQLDEVRRVMKANSRRIGQKIVFIHGKGEGVLRKAVLALLKKEYPKAELQDASFREYGFGATLVTVRN